MAPRTIEVPQVHSTDQLGDLGKEIREAQDKLLAVERRLTFQQDDSSVMFGAMASFTGAQHRIVLAMQDAIVATQQTLTAQDVRALHKEVRASAALDLAGAVDRLVVQRYRALIMATLAALVLMFAVGGIASWLVLGMPVHPVCASITGGGRICGAWTVPPPPGPQ